MLRPAILLVHGGGWRSGYRSNMAALAIRLAQRGYVAVAISYRLSPEAGYPAAVLDTKAAIRWLRRHAARYGIDAQRLALAGASAGGQIAALTAYTHGLPLFDARAPYPRVSSAVQALINIDGLSDFTSPEVLHHENDPRKNPSSAGAWFGGTYQQKTALWHQASPLAYIGPQSPPTLFVISGQQRFSLGYPEAMAQLASHHIATHVHAFPDAPHSFWLFHPWVEPTVLAIDQFLQQQFGPVLGPVQAP